MALEGYDLVMLGILAGAALLGYFKGMVWQLAWIAGIVASSYVAFRFGSVVAPFFGTQAPWNRFAAMLAIYLEGGKQFTPEAKDAESFGEVPFIIRWCTG